jgi:hypothetical protein
MRIILSMMMLNVIGGLFLSLGIPVVALVVFGITMVGLIVAAVLSVVTRNNE